ncbi:MlaD family protein [Synechococcus sp. CS-197]|uniref:MlaD family protein n=1 Tax=Synechococcus sp. CS-197 TaxID=2847985 RepID=UPI000152558D|nr:MlaD family protein [Synechococcus sp. CS-197]MCT0250335.1 MCE family protein [Synechococcus sp. CS-197]CAK22683.1 ABC-type transport system, periplasmic component [Synechococcus sp. WH 7803]
MRRSVREALVGFSLVGAIAGFAGTMLWLRGVRLGSETWTVQADFQNAGGLANRSPVTFRGITVGTVRAIDVTPMAVRATLEINQDDLQLPLPVKAVVSSASLLGGDSQVELLTTGTPVPKNAPSPKARNCKNSGVLCEGATIPGQSGASLTSVTASLEQLLDQAQKSNLIPQLVESTKQFGTTSEDASKFLDTADVAAQNVDALVQQLRAEVSRAQPTIDNLNRATAEAAAAAASINNLAKAFDNPETVSDLKQTVTNAKQLTARIDAVGGDIEQLTDDRQFMQGLRSVMIGLGAFFDEVYPARTGTSNE